MVRGRFEDQWSSRGVLDEMLPWAAAIVYIDEWRLDIVVVSGVVAVRLPAFSLGCLPLVLLDMFVEQTLQCLCSAYRNWNFFGALICGVKTSLMPSWSPRSAIKVPYMVP